MAGFIQVKETAGISSVEFIHDGPFTRQLVTTTLGNQFLDNLPGEKARDFTPGFDWKKMIGQGVVDVWIVELAGRQWIKSEEQHTILDPFAIPHRGTI